ncbi:MAG: hypothetical protein BMS9Abin17_0789 [Acidimicrobiia bacterium]|nr:MAG: hypothetical protein BMS9Abin17_0789 [Acidimicrobiia bacterium]
MRQRLLLVAGWIAAVVGSVLVASGAVTVAGGQVLDRPLRPLTAAEVAALPVVQVDSSANVEPQASGGLVPTTGQSTEGSESVEPRPKEPAGTGGSTADAGDSSGQDPLGGDLDEPAEAVVKIASVEGGRASFVVAQGHLVLLWATPAAGYVGQTRSASDTEIVVQFSSSLKVWGVEATLSDGSITIVSRTEPLT